MNRVIGLLIVMGCVVWGFQAAAIDWYRWRGPDLNGISKETGWLATGSGGEAKQVWKTSVGTGFSSMSVSNGRVYTMGNSNDVETVYCLDAADGTVRWKYSYQCPIDPNVYEGGPNATPTVDEDRVYTFSRKGDVFAFNARSGVVLWQKNIQTELGMKIPDWGLSSSPFIDGKLLILNAGSAGTALDKDSGKVLWTSGKEAAGYSSAVPTQVGKQKAVALFSGKVFQAVAIADGRVLWEFPWPTSYGANIADPILVGDKYFISSGYNQGCALLDASSGKPVAVWKNKNMRNHFNCSVLVEGFIYGFDESSELRCLDVQNGAVKWAEKGLGKGSLMAADGKLIVLGERGQLVIAQASPVGFKRLLSTQALGGKCWTTPVLSSGRIYCRNAQGDIACFDAKAH